MGGISADRHRAQAALGELLDRLGQRLPVWPLAPTESNWPERVVRPVDVFEAVPRGQSWPGLPQPVRLLARPVPLMVVRVANDRASYGRLTRLLSLGRMRAPKGTCRISRDNLIGHAAGWAMAAIPPALPDPAFAA